MRHGIATTLRRTPSGVTSLRTAYTGHASAAAHGRLSAATAITAVMYSETTAAASGSCSSSSRRAFATSSVEHFSRPSMPRFAASQWGTEQQSTSSTSKEAPFPPSLAPARSTRRRSSRTSGTQQTQSTHIEDAESQATGGREADKTAAVIAATDSSSTPLSTETRHSETTTSPSKAAPSSPDEKGTALDSAQIRDASQTDKSSTDAPKSLSARIKGLWENVKYLFRFYFNGVKQIWKNREVVSAMKKEIAERMASGQGEIRWAEKATIELHQADVRKLPLFVAILVILEEILPLVVLYAPSLLPSTCILPSQSLKMRAEEERRRGMAVQRLAGNVEIRAIVDRIVEQSCPSTSASKAASESFGAETAVASEPRNLTDLDGKTLSDIANVFGLRSWGPASLIASRIDAHLRFLQEDDRLLQAAWLTRRNGGDGGDEKTNEWYAICSGAWLWRASGRRGLRSSAADEAAMEHNLEAYLHLIERCTPASSSSVTRALLPLALYDGTATLLQRLQRQASEEQSKGLRQRTAEVVESVVQEAKRKESKVE